MSNVIGPLEFQLVADGSTLAPSIRREVGPGLDALNRLVGQSVDNARRDFDRLAGTIGDTFDGIDSGGQLRQGLTSTFADIAEAAERMAADVETALEFDQSGISGSRLVERRISELRDVAAQAERTGRELDAALDVDDNTTGDLGARARQQLNDLVDTAQEAGRDIADALDGRTAGGRQVGDGLADGAARAALAIEREFTDAARNVTRSLTEIGDTDFGDDLTAQARRSADQVVGEFDGIGRRIATEIDTDLRSTSVEIRVPADVDIDRRELDDAITDAEQPRTLRVDAEVDDSDFQQFRSDLDGIRSRLDLDFDTQIRLDDSQLRQAFQVAQQLDGLVADIDVNTDASELLAAQRLGEALDGFVASVDVEADQTALRDALGLAEQLDRLQAVVDVQVRDEALRSAVRLADDLDTVRRVDVDVDDSEIDAARRRLEALDIPTIDLDIDTSQARDKVEGLFDGLDFSNLSGSLTDAVTGALTAAGPAGAAAAAGGLALGGLIGTAFFQGVEREAETDRLTASLGLTGPKADRVIAAAESLFADAYGQSFEEVADVVGDAAALAIPDLERMSGIALSMQSAFGLAAGEMLQLSEQLRIQGVVDTTEEALDGLTASFQQLPSNLREPLADALREYGTFLSDLGFSTEEIFAGLTGAAERGEFELDKFGDAIKEFSIRATDDSDATVLAFDRIGIAAGEYDQVTQDIVTGGERARAAFQRVVEGILAIEDPIERANTAIALFGTPLEDLSVTEIPRFLRSFADLEKGLDDFAGAAAGLDQQINDNLAVALETYRRQWDQAITDVGQGLVDQFETGNSAELRVAAEDLGELTGEAVKAGFEAALGEGGGLEALLEGFIAGAAPELEVGGQSLGDRIAEGSINGLRNTLNPLNPLRDAFDRVFGDGELEATAEAGGVRAGAAYGAGLVDAGAGQGFVENEQARFDQLRGSVEAVGPAAGRAAEEMAAITLEAELAAAEADLLRESIERTLGELERLNSIGGGGVFRGLISDGEDLVDVFEGLTPAIVNSRGEFDRTDEAGRRAEAALEGYRETLADLAEQYVNGNIDAGKFADGQATIENNVRTALEQLGLTGPVLEGLVDKYGALSTSAQEDIRALATEFLNQLSIQERAALAFGQLSPVARLQFDLDRDGLIEAEEAAVQFSELQRSATLGFDYDNSGQVEAEEAANALEQAEFLAKIGFDVDYDGVTDAEERAQAFDVIRSFAELGWDINRDGIVDAEEEGARFALNTWLASLGLDIDDVFAQSGTARAEMERFDQLRAEAELGINTSEFDDDLSQSEAEANRFAQLNFQPGLDADSTAFDDQISAAEAEGYRLQALTFEPGLGADSSGFDAAAQAVEAEGNRLADLNFIPTLDAEPEPFNEVVSAAEAMGYDFAGLTFEPGLDADPAGFDDTVAAATADGLNFEGLTFEPGLDADPGGFNSVLSAANAAGAAFDVDQFIADLLATDLATGEVNRVIAANNGRTINLNIDADGSFAENEIRRLRSLASTPVRIPISSGGGGSTTFFGDGGLATAPGIVGEEFRPELVLPLTKPGRVRDLLGAYGGDLIAAAGGVNATLDALLGGGPPVPDAVSSGAAFGDGPPVASVAGRAGGPVTNNVTNSNNSVVNQTIHLHGVDAREAARDLRNQRRDDILVGLRVRG